MKLDWSKIDNEKTFQNLVNHLFFLECPSSLVLCPSAHILAKTVGGMGSIKDVIQKRTWKEDIVFRQNIPNTT